MCIYIYICIHAYSYGQTHMIIVKVMLTPTPTPFLTVYTIVRMPNVIGQAYASAHVRRRLFVECSCSSCIILL